MYIKNLKKQRKKKYLLDNPLMPVFLLYSYLLFFRKLNVDKRLHIKVHICTILFTHT